MVMNCEPDRIERVGETALKVRWTDGHESHYGWAALRLSCPCAACREAPPSQPDSRLKALEILPVGRYALHIRWSDGHTTGIYSFEFLRSLCPCEECRPGQFTEG